MMEGTLIIEKRDLIERNTMKSLHSLLISRIGYLEKMQELMIREKIIIDFASKFIENSKDIEPEFQEIINREFWNLLDENDLHQGRNIIFPEVKSSRKADH